MSIYTNKDIMYINTINNKMASDILDTLSIKFCGFLGDKVIVSLLNNEKIIIINQSDFNGVILSEKRNVKRDSVAVKPTIKK